MHIRITDFGSAKVLKDEKATDATSGEQTGESESATPTNPALCKLNPVLSTLKHQAVAVKQLLNLLVSKWIQSSSCSAPPRPTCCSNRF